MDMVQMDEGTKIALFNQELAILHEMEELYDLCAKGKSKQTYNFKLERTVEQCLDDAIAANDALYRAFKTLGIDKEYLKWSYGKKVIICFT